MPSRVGAIEIVVIAVVLVVLFGGKKIPEFIKGLGKGVKEFKKGVSEDVPNKEDE